jgi:amidophosphoribosyltransferase
MADLGEKCAVFGVYGKGLDVSRLSFFGLYALQHRGQESSGIAVADGESTCLHKGMGLVSQIFNEEVIDSLKGHIAIGHNRYSTTGGSKLKHAQPMLSAGAHKLEHMVYEDANPSLHESISLCSAPGDGAIALAHNGNLPSTKALEAYVRDHEVDTNEFSDSRMAVEAIGAAMREGASLEDAIREIYPLLTGAFSILVMSADKLVAIRDRCGIRPLSLAKLNGGYVFASETCAFPPIGADFLRDVAPGEMVMVDETGVRTEQLAEPEQKLDIFEFVYFARPDSRLMGRSVYDVRRRFGAQLAKENDLPIDVIIPVPETATPSAIGFSQESGVPMELGLAKNRYIHRTFIQPEQHIREQGVKAKLSPIREVIEGKRVAVIDDSIVRGTTSQQIVKMLFDAGATEVHFLVASPPVKYPDFYGIDTPKQEKLIAATKSVEEIRDFLGATSVRYLSYEGMIAAIGVPESQLCTSCFTGNYPIDIGERAKEVRRV